MRGSVLRFLEALQQPLDAEILGPALVRELYFRVLTGALGDALVSNHLPEMQFTGHSAPL